MYSFPSSLNFPSFLAPVSPLKFMKSSYETTSALNGGEDYELVFTANPKHLNVLLNQGFSSIGVIKNKKDGCNIILENNDKTELKPMGWSNKL